MKDGVTYGERALNAFEAVVDDNDTELAAQLDAMSVDDLYDLMWRGEKLRMRTREVWRQRTTQPSERPR